MRSLTGLLLMLTGIAVGAHAYYPDMIERHVHISDVARAIAPTVPMTHDAGDRVPAFAPATHMIGNGAPGTGSAIKTVRDDAVPLLNAPKLVRSNDWDATVVRATGNVAAPNLSESERWRLVRDLQSELRRVGCYSGRIDGSWGAGSRYAIQEFMVQVNASLPTEQPDPIMLSLIQSHQETVCGKTCEGGYTKSDNGRCLPYAITAQKARPEPAPAVLAPPRLVRSRAGEAAVAALDEPADVPVRDTKPRRYPDGRMAVGGPVGADINPRLSGTGAQGAPPVTRAEPRVAPPVTRAEPRVAPAPQPAYRPRANKTHKSKPRRVAKRRSTYNSESSRTARRRALIRQAFGDGFN